MCSIIGNCGCDTLKYIKMHCCFLCCWCSCDKPSEYQRSPLSLCELAWVFNNCVSVRVIQQLYIRQKFYYIQLFVLKHFFRNNYEKCPFSHLSPCPPKCLHFPAYRWMLGWWRVCSYWHKNTDAAVGNFLCLNRLPNKVDVYYRWLWRVRYVTWCKSHDWSSAAQVGCLN